MGGNNNKRQICEVGTDNYSMYVQQDDGFEWGFFCFIGSSSILMADLTTKPIKDINIGDMVISSKTGLPQKVILKHISTVNKVKLFGLNDTLPFSTISHPFISHKNKYLTLDKDHAINKIKLNKDEVRRLKIGSVLKTFDDEIKPIIINNITYEDKNEPTELYNIYTEDNSFFVNNFSVFDTMPNFKEHIKVSLRLGFIIELIAENNLINEHFDELFNKYYNIVIDKEIDEQLYDMYFNKIVGLTYKNQKYIDLLINYWNNYFDKLNV